MKINKAILFLPYKIGSQTSPIYVVYLNIPTCCVLFWMNRNGKSLRLTSIFAFWKSWIFLIVSSFFGMVNIGALHAINSLTGRRILRLISWSISFWSVFLWACMIQYDAVYCGFVPSLSLTWTGVYVYWTGQAWKVEQYCFRMVSSFSCLLTERCVWLSGTVNKPGILYFE